MGSSGRRETLCPRRRAICSRRETLRPRLALKSRSSSSFVSFQPSVLEALFASGPRSARESMSPGSACLHPVRKTGVRKLL